MKREDLQDWNTAWTEIWLLKNASELIMIVMTDESQSKFWEN